VTYINRALKEKDDTADDLYLPWLYLPLAGWNAKTCWRQVGFFLHQMVAGLSIKILD
jgi:hypothetical protein